VERGVPIHPVAIAYSSDDAAYVGETSFRESLVAVARAPRLEVHLAILPPVTTHGLKRRQAAGLARSLINPQLSPGTERTLHISQEEIGHLSGLSRQRVNHALQVLEKRSLLRVEHVGITVTDLPGLRSFVD
jgi:CRP-like cAMP-binding protein